MTVTQRRQRPVGELLRQWRELRRLSQLALAVQSDISTRHLSFVETAIGTEPRHGAAPAPSGRRVGRPRAGRPLRRAGRLSLRPARARDRASRARRCRRSPAHSHGDGELGFFGTVATFGTPLDITVAELAIESFFPADATTAAALQERRD